VGGQFSQSFDESVSWLKAELREDRRGGQQLGFALDAEQELQERFARLPFGDASGRLANEHEIRLRQLGLLHIAVEDGLNGTARIAFRVFPTRQASLDGVSPGNVLLPATLPPILADAGAETVSSAPLEVSLDGIQAKALQVPLKIQITYLGLDVDVQFAQSWHLICSWDVPGNYERAQTPMKQSNSGAG
jgi:hypothetical protein